MNDSKTPRKRLYRVELELALPVVATSPQEAQEIALANFRDEYVTAGDFWVASSPHWDREDMTSHPWGDNEDLTVAQWFERLGGE